MANANANASLVSAITLAYGAAMTQSQLNFAVSIAFETLPAVLNKAAKFKMSEFARQVEQASGYTLAEKTVANVGSVSRQLQDKFGALIGAYDQGHTADSVLHFADFLRNELSKTTYTLTLDDIAAYCKGESSRADKRAKAEEARKAAAEALAEAEAKRELAKQAAREDQNLADAEKQKADAEAAVKAEEDKRKQAEEEAAAAKVAKEEADKRAAQLAEANRIQAEEMARIKAEADKAEAEAEAKRKQEQSFAIRVTVDADGNPVIHMADNQSPAFLEEVAKQIKAAAAAIRKAQRTSLKAA